MAQFKFNFRRYTVVLVVFYLCAVVVFHSNLDPSEGHRKQRNDPGLQAAPTNSPVLQRGQVLNGHDVIEERNEGRRVKLDPDSRASRILKEFKTSFVVTDANKTKNKEPVHDVSALQIGRAHV